MLSSNSLTVSADGNVTVGSGAGTIYNAGAVTITNPTGNTTIGSVGSNVIINGGLTVNSTSGSITTVVGGSINSNRVSFATATGDINAPNVSSANVTASAKNINLGFTGVSNPSVFVSGNGTVTLTSPSSLTVASMANESGASSVAAAGKLTLGRIHIGSSLPTSFSGQSVVDSVDGVFVYGPTSFIASSGDVAIVKGNHSFGPVSATATGNVTIFENAAINMNNIRGTNVSFKTSESIFQTPVTASLLATKLSLIGSSNVVLYAGTISNGLTINTIGNVDLGRLSLATNLNSVAPVIIATGAVTNPSP